MNVVLEVLMKQGEIIFPWLSVVYDCRLTSKYDLRYHESSRLYTLSR